ncbi:hypothetical protein Sste5346_003440 [Sporothrix stenoceras]|uniref:MEI5 protein n=1 Tax=Sporothrix stenoceras TaxID=5173 RepID=A0ABR3ZCX1_9PEZI
MPANGVNGTGAMTNGSSPPHVPPPLTPPLQTAELPERIDSLRQGLQTIQQHSNILDVVDELILDNKQLKDAFEDNKHLKAALDVNYGRIHQVEKKNNELESQLSSKEATIQMLQTLVEELQKDASDKEVALKDSSKETVKLKSEVADKSTKLEAVNKAKEALTKDKTGLEAKVAKQAAELAKIKDRFGRLQEQKDAQVDAIQSQLDTLNNYAAPLHDLPLREVSEKLGGIFQGAFHLVNNCFDTDLPPRVFARGNDDLDTFHKALADTSGAIPLPPSNTPEAKRMRTAAVLRFLAHVAHKELFQPFYALGRSNDLAVLIDTRIDDADHADFVRRVLLNTEMNAELGPDSANHVMEQTDLRVKSVQRAMKKVVGGIPSPEAQDTFFTALARWCYETTQVWREDIQPLQFGIEVHNEIDHDDDDSVVLEEWRPLSELLPASSSAAAADAGRAPALASRRDVAAHVWPLFYTNGEIALKGVVVTMAQVADAQREVDQIAVQKDSSRRATRASARRGSTVTTTSAPGTPSTTAGQRSF